MRVTNGLRLAAGTLEAMAYAYTASRAWAVKRDHAPSQDSAGAPLLDRQTNVVVSCHQCGTSAGVRHRAIDSSELRLTTDREGRQVGQHRSHIVVAVSSACLIARAAAGPQGRIVSSLSPGRPRGRTRPVSKVVGSGEGLHRGLCAGCAGGLPPSRLPHSSSM